MCIDHRLGMKESCVKGVMSGIRLCQQSSLLHQTALVAMASGILPGVQKRKICHVHLLDSWYSLALAAPHIKYFFYMKEPEFPEALGRHSPSRRLPGLIWHEDMTEHELSA